MFPPSTELREHPRHKLVNTFIVSEQGVYRVFDISKRGMSFGCIDRRDIPEELFIDIVDDQGFHLPDLPVAKVWSAKNKDLNTDRIYKTVVGAKFSDELTTEQQSTLNQLLVES